MMPFSPDCERYRSVGDAQQSRQPTDCPFTRQMVGANADAINISSVYRRALWALTTSRGETLRKKEVEKPETGTGKHEEGHTGRYKTYRALIYTVEWNTSIDRACGAHCYTAISILIVGCGWYPSTRKSEYLKPSIESVEASI